MTLQLITFPDRRLTQSCVSTLDEGLPVKLPVVSHETHLEMQRVLTVQEGLALAANQVGIFEDFFVLSERVDWSGYVEAPLVPTLIWMRPVILETRDPVMFKESCLSLPGVVGTNRRFNSITVDVWHSPEQRETYRISGLLAVVVQHEIDHLHGRLFHEQLDPFNRRKADRAINKLRRKKTT